MRPRLVIVIVVLAAVAALLVYRARVVDTAGLRVQRALRTSLRGGRYPSRIASGEDSTALLVHRFYKQHKYAPVWSDGIHENGMAHELVAVLDSAADEGLESGDYLTPRLRELLEHDRPISLRPGDDAKRLAEIDLGLTAGFLRYASDLFDGRVDPRRLPTEWLTRRRRTSLQAQLETAIRGHRVAETLQALAPRHADYARLRDALARDRALAAHGGWPTVPAGPVLRRGARGARVHALKGRLAAEGDLPRTRASGVVFDAPLEQAVEMFQRRNGLDPTRRAGPEEIALMNIPVEARIHQIELNMERWRWLPDTLGRRAIIVNIPDFTLRVVEDGRPVLGMRVVVGQDVNRTPVFSDSISHIVFGPSWNIPEQIVSEEIVPAMQEKPDYLALNHIRILDGEREIDPRSLDWSSPSNVVRYAFRQDPGPGNALGHVKFMCPNRFNVYLHDTPAGHLFSARERDFSHGCIRVERPDELAEYLLADHDAWSRSRIVQAMNRSLDSSVTLPQPVPVHILYWTAWVDDRGAVQFRKDIYDLDAIVDGALRRHEQAVSSTARAATRAVAASSKDGPRNGARQDKRPAGFDPATRRRHGSSR